jgi:hypothetical protein
MICTACALNVTIAEDNSFEHNTRYTRYKDNPSQQLTTLYPSSTLYLGLAI